MKILITGHKGFIGRHLFEDWKDRWHRMTYGIDLPDDIANFDKGGEELIKNGNADETGYDVIVHLAAWTDIRESLEDPEKYYENNVAKSKPIFDYCWETGTRLIYASSSAVDGPYWVNPYATSKWMLEQMAPPNSVGLRLTTVYGSDSRDNMMYGMLKNGTAPYITNHKRDWIHVDDVVSVITRLAKDGDVNGIIPVGSGESVPVKKLAEAFGQGDLPVRTDTPGEVEDNVADISILRSLGWSPTIKILDFVNADLQA